MDGLLGLLADIIHFRYSLAGLFGGSIVGLLYKKLMYGTTESSAGNDGLFIITVVCTLIGLAFDIRRGLKN